MRTVRHILSLGFIFLVMTGFLPARPPLIPIVTGALDSRLDLQFQDHHFVLDLRIDTLFLENLGGPEGWAGIVIPGFMDSRAVGEPALPETSILFEAGEDAIGGIRIEVLDSVCISLESYLPGARLVPGRPAARKGKAAEDSDQTVDYMPGDVWLGGPLLDVHYEGRMRGLDLSRLQCCPVRYNPARSELWIYHRLRARIHLQSSSPALPHQDLFRKVQARVVRQEQEPGFKALQVEQAMGLVILSDTMFREALKPFVEWKERKGFRVDQRYIQDTETGRDRDSVKSMLRQLYFHPAEGNPPPSYLLIVGDVEQVPTSMKEGEVTDLYYACYDSEGDYIPDLFYGRISVSTVEELEAVTSKILEYEQYAFPDPGFLDRNMLIAGVDGQYASTFGNGQINYAHNLYLGSAGSYESYLFPYPESGSSAARIRELFSEGLGFVNYTGHGEEDRWANPSFTTGHIPGLENRGMYPVVIGNGCRTNDFSAEKCFAEALLRAPGSGALAYIGCTNDSYWDEDYYWSVGMGPVRVYPEYGETRPGCYDKIFHTHGEDREIWTPSLGEMVFGGNMSVQESSSSSKKFYWEIYQLAGDPTLLPWFGQADRQQAVVPDRIPPSSRRLDVICSPWSYVAVSMNGRLLDARHASGGGLASLHIPDSPEGSVLDLLISAEGFIPLQRQVLIEAAEGAHLELLKYEIANESIEEDGACSPGEELQLDLLLLNRGSETWKGDSLFLHAESPSLEVDSHIFLAGALAAGDSLRLEGAFTIRAGQHLVDGERARLILTLGSEPIPVLIELLQSAPQLRSLGITWDDRPNGNGNGMAEAGEWISCHWRVINEGSFRTDSLWVPGMTGLTRDRMMGPGEQQGLSFSVQMTGMEPGMEEDHVFTLVDKNVLLRDSLVFLIGAYREDFSSVNPDRFPFRNGGAKPWLIDSSTYASHPYSLRSGGIGHAQQSSLSLQVMLDQADTMSFDFRTSTEAHYDHLVFLVDGEEAMRESGHHDWDHFSMVLDSGRHTISWTYTKDQYTAKGEDAAWIDDIVLPGNCLRAGDLSLMDIPEPLSGPWLGSKERIAVAVANHAPDAALPVRIQFFAGGEIVEEKEFVHPLEPGASGLYISGPVADLSAFGSTLIGARILSDSFGYSGNNQLRKVVRHHVFPDLSLELEDGPCRGTALVTVVNRGNVAMAPLEMELWVDQVKDMRQWAVPSLEAGAFTSLDLALADSLRPLEPGRHDFRLTLLVNDSVPGNNVVEWSQDCFTLGEMAGVRVSEWTLYPNPGKGIFLLCMGDELERDAEFQLLGLDGRILKAFRLEAGKQEYGLDMGAMPPGSYLLREVKRGRIITLIISD